MFGAAVQQILRPMIQKDHGAKLEAAIARLMAGEEVWGFHNMGYNIGWWSASAKLFGEEVYVQWGYDPYSDYSKFPLSEFLAGVQAGKIFKFN